MPRKTAGRLLSRFLVVFAFSASLSQAGGVCTITSPPPVPIWQVLCAGTGPFTTRPFQLTGDFDLYLSGDAENLKLENVTRQESLEIRPDRLPGRAWLKFRFQIPASWRGQDLRITALEPPNASTGWLAFSAPSAPSVGEDSSDALRVLLRMPFFALLFFLPGFTLAAFAIRRGMRGVIKLGLVLLAGIAAPGYGLFFVYLLSARLGFYISACLPFACTGLLAILLWKLPVRDRKPLRVLLVPATLTLLAAMGNLTFGYFYNPGMSAPNATAQVRFSHLLPADNALPFLFADGLLKGKVPRPIEEQWLSSDRPPLQTGMVLALEPWMTSPTRHELCYHMACVIAQSLWIFAVWLLLRALRVAPLTSGLVSATIYFSGFAIVNTFYVWPKLLAGAYLVAFAVPVLAVHREAGGMSWILRCLFGFLLACSLLAHGGTIFALIGLLALFRWRMRKTTIQVVAIALLFYLPWIGYQQFVDPPGDRLLKYQLAGVEAVNAKPALQTVYDAYRGLTGQQWLAAKKANLKQVFSHELDYWRASDRAQIRALEFFYFLPSLGVAMIGIAFLPLRWTRLGQAREMRSAERLLLWAFATAIPWVFILFTPDSTVVHQGAYSMELMAMAGGILSFRSVVPLLAAGVCVGSWLFHWIVYYANLASSMLSPHSLAFGINHWMMTLHAVSLCGFFAMVFRPWFRKWSRKSGSSPV